MSNESNSSGGCSGCLIAVVFLVIFVGLFGSCSGGSRHSSYSGRGSSSTTVEEEVQHYHYDTNGHIYDDRD